MLSDWMPFCVVRDPDLRDIVDRSPTRYRQDERHDYGAHKQHEPEYPSLSAGRMLDIERSLRDRGRSD